MLMLYEKKLNIKNKTNDEIKKTNDDLRFKF